MLFKLHNCPWTLLQPTLLALLLSLCALPPTTSAFLVPRKPTDPHLSRSPLNLWSTSPHTSDHLSVPPSSDAKPHVRPKGTTFGGGARKRDKRLLSSSSHKASSFGNDTNTPPSSPLNRHPQEPIKRATSSSDIPDTWVISRAFQGESFFNNWGFATYPDPTHGQVTYVSEEWASSTNMSYVNSAGQAIMRVDNWSVLTQGQSRNSIRIESNDVFNKGLFILDVEAAPWGCGVWPAWWTVGGNWPYQGEIDILEGVHDNVHNQVTFHTADNCSLVTPTAATPGSQNFTGGISTTDCYAYAASNAGCAVIDPSVASYGTQFNVLGGGVFAMLWLDESIRVWFFHRAAIPSDIADSDPKPSTWGTPTTYLGNGCDIPSHFSDHQLVFDITFCGDWAGNSYISSGCPGTCSDRIQDPTNFANASWTINYVHVFGSPDISSTNGTSSAATSRTTPVSTGGVLLTAALLLGLNLV